MGDKASKRDLEDGDKGENPQTTSLFSAIFNLTKSAVGGGMLFMPVAAHQMGYIPAFLMLFGIALACCMSLHFLGRLSRQFRLGDYVDISRKMHGSNGEFSTIFMLILFLVIPLVLYLQRAGQYSSQFLRDYLKWAPESFMCSKENMTIVFAIPIALLSLMRDPSSLAPFSLVGMAAMSYVVLLSVGDYFLDKTAQKVTPVPVADGFMGHFGSVFASFIFAYMCHFTVPPLVHTLKKQTASRVRMIVVGAGSITTALYALFILFTYLHYGPGLINNGDVMDPLSLEKTMSLPYAVAQMLIALVMVVSYPLCLIPARDCVERLIYMSVASKMSMEAFQKGATIRRIILTFLMVFIYAFIAYAFGDKMGFIIGLIAGSTGPFLVFFLPSMYFLQSKDKLNASGFEVSFAYLNYVMGGLLFFFAFVMLLYKKIMG